MSARIDIPKEEIATFCQRNHIRRMALFGSVLRDDFTPESDIDVLVEFEPDQTPGLEFITMQDELSDILGRQVDLHTFKGVESSRNWLRREEILSSAEVQYEQT
ncbi:MAG: nucleotidyltransferase family protein [Gemmatimonadota bacterium]|nr:nucleotidyltransferase family protein [Gemmatimonadota bacterium]